MKLTLIFLTVLISITTTLSANWQNIRNTSVTEDGNILLRFESDTEADSFHQISYFDAEQWLDSEVERIGEQTLQSLLPYDNQDPLPISFKVDTGDTLLIRLGMIADESPFALNKMSHITSYERNSDIANHLNIASESTVLNNDRFNFALTNFGGGFPISGGFFGPFYSYTVSLWHSSPDNPDFVYSLIYTVNLPPFISSGLYKIDANDESLLQIGQITSRIVQNDNTLYLSCSLADILNDEDFARGYSHGDPLYISTMTQKIEDFGNRVTIQDQGNIHIISFDSFTIQPFENSLPVISNVGKEHFDNHTTVSLRFYDAESHFPMIAHLITPDDSVYNFVHETADFSREVTFTALIPDSLQAGLIRFSDNGYQFVERTVSYPGPNVSIAASNGQVILSWEAMDFIGIYKVYSSGTPSENNLDWDFIGTTEGTEFRQNIEDHRIRYYRVVAIREE